MISDIQKLRDITGAGVMECKRAFIKAGGDMKRAQQLLHEQGLIRAEEKGQRKMGAGVLEAYVHNNRIGVLLLARCETDFVARGDLFKTFAHHVAMHISAMNPASVDELLSQFFVRDESITVHDVIKSVIAKTGENVRIERFARFEL